MCFKASRSPDILERKKTTLHYFICVKPCLRYGLALVISLTGSIYHQASSFSSYYFTPFLEKHILPLSCYILNGSRVGPAVAECADTQQPHQTVHYSMCA